ncbi:3-dehydroquinate synthase [uncultured Gammaproteobacteria bacterium]
MSKTVPETVRVNLGPRSYDIVVGTGVLAEAGSRIAAMADKRRVIVISDQTVAGLHLATLERSLVAAGVATTGPALLLPPGEGAKSFARLEQVLDNLLGRGIDRGTMLVALGGGVVGDLVGFVAAIALRGLDFIQIPTTLLAQVDSSVGGKTGINSRHGKNLIGAFHQPQLVLADITTLDSLPVRDVRAGYAEVVKYGLINDPAFFDWLEAHGPALLKGDHAARTRAVVTSCRAKAAVVGADERESGDRALLNLGHTFGHALETACGYDDRLHHGEAVAVGMVLAFELSVRLGLAPAADALRVRQHLFQAGLPTGPGDLPTVPWRPAELVGHMAHDKKTRDGRLTFVLARGIGQSFVAHDVDPAEVEAVLAGHA